MKKLGVCQDFLRLFYRYVRGNHRLYYCEKVGNLRLFYQCVRVHQKECYVSTNILGRKDGGRAQEFVSSTFYSISIPYPLPSDFTFAINSGQPTYV